MSCSSCVPALGTTFRIAANGGITPRREDDLTFNARGQNARAYTPYEQYAPMTRPLSGFAEVAAPAPDNSGTSAMVGIIVVGTLCVGLIILIESGK